MLRIGLTGGIGSGKSTVADMFAAHGIPIIDTDQIAHELTGPGGAAMTAIATAFGPTVIAADGRLDRQAMRQRVFSTPGERQTLEAILHPLIRIACDQRVAAAAEQHAPYAILAIPLLVEAGDFSRRVDRVLVVDCPEETQIARVMARNGLPREEVERILAAQASRAQRLAVADDLIDNGGEATTLPARVAALHQQYCAAAISDAGRDSSRS